jgi:hypothetical protein
MPYQNVEGPEDRRIYSESDVAGIKSRLDNVTDMLCATLAMLEFETDLGVKFNELPPKVKNWWKTHKKADAKKAAEEAKKLAKVKALSKLTKEEKKLLGL